jgi:hypothetical protein
MRKGIEVTAPKGRFLTLADVISFTEIAMQDGARMDTTVHGQVSFGGKLQKLTITFDTDTKE